MRNPIFGQIDPTNMLLHSKMLEPLSVEQISELRKIEKFSKLDSYSEQDVREDIIAPILRVLGYQKESIFSVERDKSLWIVGKRLAFDYSLTLWEENFWIIEAKKPSITKGKFGYDEVWQALQYAVHPTINAALLVLCDGHAIEVFDREQSLEIPVLRIDRVNLIRDFDQIRAILSPLQAWFFQKRRIVRLIDKVLGREYNLGRLDELGKLLQRSIDGKQQTVVENMRKIPRSDDDLGWIQKAEPTELVHGIMPLRLSLTMINAMSENLVTRCKSNASFPILLQIFPDHPRAVSQSYFPNALHFLIRLSEQNKTVGWLPSWLATEQSQPNLDRAIKQLIKLSLTGFRENMDWQIVLLFAAASRRLAKALMVLIPSANNVGQLRHLSERFMGNEFSFSQFVSSPERHSLLELENLSEMATKNFIVSNIDKNGRLNTETARHDLVKSLNSELLLLSKVGNYSALLKQKNFGEVYPTEAVGVCYDSLGHEALCLLDSFPEWKEYVISKLRPELDSLVSLGSWQARKWLGINVEDVILPTEQEYAERFFFGDVKLSAQFREVYMYP
jgi:Type I restriction enzyme R protein N terminus (HSDR_N)